MPSTECNIVIVPSQWEPLWWMVPWTNMVAKLPSHKDFALVTQRLCGQTAPGPGLLHCRLNLPTLYTLDTVQLSSEHWIGVWLLTLTMPNAANELEMELEVLRRFDLLFFIPTWSFSREWVYEWSLKAVSEEKSQRQFAIRDTVSQLALGLSQNLQQTKKCQNLVVGKIFSKTALDRFTLKHRKNHITKFEVLHLTLPPVPLFG